MFGSGAKIVVCAAVLGSSIRGTVAVRFVSGSSPASASTSASVFELSATISQLSVISCQQRINGSNYAIISRVSRTSFERS